MFQFTTTTLVNNGDAASVIKRKKNGTEAIVGFRVKEGPSFKLDEKDCIEVYKALYKAEEVDTATINVAACSDSTKTYRINLYVRSQGNADPFYANDFVFKGKPFIVEFAGNAKAADKVKSLADKYMISLYDMKQLDITADSAGTTLTVKGINGFLRFHKIAVEEWVPAVASTASYTEGYWKVLAEINKEDADKLTDSTGKITLTEGCEGVGTYEQVLADLRLPTGDNFAYLNVNAPQMPIVGGKYTQYTFRMNHDLVNYPGGIGINNPVKSITTHVFFVESGAVEAFETALKDGLGKDFTSVTESAFETKDTDGDLAVSDTEAIA